MAALHSASEKKVDVAQAAKDVRLREPHSGLNCRFVARTPRPGWQDADAVMGRHRAVAAVYLGVVERGLVDGALEIVRHQQARRRPEKAEHADMGTDPVRQRLRPSRLGVGQAGGAEHGDEDLRHAHLAGGPVDDWHLLAGVVHERLVTGHMLLAHRRRQPPFKLPEQLAETAVRIALRVRRPVFLPKHQQIDPGTLEFAHKGRPVRLGMEPSPGSDPGVDEQPRHQALVGHVRCEGPADPGGRRAAEILAYRARRDAQLQRDHPAARPGTKVHRQQVSYPPHG